jgi:hypothetical protein
VGEEMTEQAILQLARIQVTSIALMSCDMN